MKTLFAVLVVLLCATAARAQTTTGYTFKVSNQGAPSPFQTTPLTAASFTCAQPKTTVTGTVANPHHIFFDDPANPTTADCVYTDNGTGPLLALPFGTQIYTATLAATNSAGTGPDSAVSNPFSHPGVAPSALTGVRAGS